MRITESKLRSVIRSVIKESWRDFSNIAAIRDQGSGSSGEGDYREVSLKDDLLIRFDHCGKNFIHSDNNPDYYAVKIRLSGRQYDIYKHTCELMKQQFIKLIDTKDYSSPEVKAFRQKDIDIKYNFNSAAEVESMIKIQKRHDARVHKDNNPFEKTNPVFKACNQISSKEKACVHIDLHSDIRGQYGNTYMDFAVNSSIDFNTFVDEVVKCIKELIS